MSEVTDAALIEAVLGGDEEAFGRLVDRYQHRVFRLLGRFSRDPGEIEDLAQEVFLKVFRKLDTFQADSGLFTWIYRIAVNTANDHFTRRSRRPLRLVESEQLDGSSSEDDSTAPIEPLLERELHAVTAKIVSELPEKFRTALILREYEDLSYAEIAEVVGCSMGTVESRIFRARQRFRVALEQQHPDLVPGNRRLGQKSGGKR
ncbi:MAG: sigma-70 family RNA polymerase sigma factor [Planctomycetota bacterium]